MWRRSLTGALVAFSLAGCASAPFPDETLRGVDRSLRLDALRSRPAASRGARVMLGGQIIATMPKPGVTEISCHPGYPESRPDAIYDREREVELQTLTAEQVKKTIAEEGIRLISYRDYNRMSRDAR